MKITHCRALVAAFDCGSFTEAARRLGITQSAVSHAVAALEADLDCVLLERDRTGVRLTQAGSAIINHARAILAHADEMRRNTGRIHGEAGGVVRFATSQSFSQHLLPSVVSYLRTDQPTLSVELREGTDQQIARWLRIHAVDVGVVTLPKAGIATVSLWRDELQVLLPAAHRLTRTGAVDLRELAEESLVLPVGGVEPSIRAALQLVGAEPAVAYRMQDINGLVAMVAEGLAIAVLPARALRSLPGGIRAVPLNPTVNRQVALGISGTSCESRTTRSFVRAVLRVANQNGTQSPVAV
ncbi:LysR family transcriptional regulator [Frankia sp. AiPs1]|uniref:LysR family transcriptional regulator n=1 Tax=Frankia sp. AiPs1 TaxID=573493 RepID=UPI002042C4F3|nr:LysR family transcriptional regulator [Frankia sp. AiPs1]MCM3920531.1 LysR family transcriptional regulator [Frankia sp. AiPs1]